MLNVLEANKPKFDRTRVANLIMIKLISDK